MMIDFHSHILPDMDDGSRSLEESAALLRESYRQGVDVIAATSHFYAFENSPEDFLARRRRAWVRLSGALTEDMPAIRLGAEVQYFEGICQVPELRRLRLEGTRLLLVEMPFSHWSSRAVADVIELNRREEFQVMLAHIERYLHDQPDSVWDQLLAEGILMQSNASFFLRWNTKRRALKLLESGRIHLLGSDCHNMETRPPRLEEAAAAIRAKLGHRSLRRMDALGRELLSGGGEAFYE